LTRRLTHMPAIRLLLFVALLLVGVPAAAQGKKTGISRTPASVTVLGKLRMAMLQWYCIETTAHHSERPCLNFVFMQKMRKADSSEARKALVAERAQSMPSDDAGRKKVAQDSREGYINMYKAYCAQPAPSNAEVCSNESLKKMYQAFERSADKSAMPLRM